MKRGLANRYISLCTPVTRTSLAPLLRAASGEQMKGGAQVRIETLVYVE
jgi:hypothetical protein